MTGRLSCRAEEKQPLDPVREAPGEFLGTWPPNDAPTTAAVNADLVQYRDDVGDVVVVVRWQRGFPESAQVDPQHPLPPGEVAQLRVPHPRSATPASRRGRPAPIPTRRG